MDITDSKVIALTGYSLILGAALGICWGIFSFARILLTPSEPADIKGRVMADFVTFAVDVLFALFSAVCTVFLFFGANNGRIRLLGLVGCAAGFALYHYTVGKRLLNILSRCVGTVRRAIYFIYSATLKPVFSFAGRLMKKPVHAAARRKAARREKKKKKKRLRSKDKYSI